MDAQALETHYRRYLHSLNEHRTADLSDFVHDRVTYNGKSLSRQDYQNMIAGDIAAVPDLHFEPHHLLVNDNVVAARINFDCVPVRDFFGVQPNGKRIQFSEHVFYRFEEGKIREVWSLIDKAAIAAQLRA